MSKDKQDSPETGSTEERLLSAAVEVLAERGYRGATTREIAEAAGVNEVTLFRLFSTKDNLLAEALIALSDQDQDLVPSPTGDLRSDLERLATTMANRMSEGGHLLMVVLPEITRLPDEHAARVREAVSGSREVNMDLFRYYQERGELNAELGDDIWMTFMGPMLARLLYSEFHKTPLNFDAREHVALFLNGCGTGRA